MTDQEKNQCDGCQRGLDRRTDEYGAWHEDLRSDGRRYGIMGCTKERYQGGKKPWSACKHGNWEENGCRLGCFWKAEPIKAFDQIGMWKGENISEMSREKLLEFAAWAGERITSLEKIERETADFRIDKEVRHG